MAPFNAYKTPAPLVEQPYHAETPEDAYDLNFLLNELPIPEFLETPGGVRLVPLVPSVHAQALHELLVPHPQVYDYLPYGPFDSLTPFLTFLEGRRQDSTTLLFAIYDQSLVFPSSPSTTYGPTHPARLAGLLGALRSSEEHRQSEIGHIHILPAFQRSHVTTHACGLLTRWLFDDVGLRRVQWCANDLNVPSVRAGGRLGFEYEGIGRWDRVLGMNKEGGTVVPVGTEEVESKMGRGRGRHTATLALGWDKWASQGKEHLAGLMGRIVEPRDASVVGR